MLDFISIGAINVDYIATRERLLHLDPETEEELRKKFEHGDERQETKEQIDYLKWDKSDWSDSRLASAAVR